MRITQVLALVVILSAIVVIGTSVKDTSSYVNFTEAKKLSENFGQKKIHVVGTLKKDRDGVIQGIEESPDHLAFKFLMVDKNNTVEEVMYANPMPIDFIKSDQVVIIGSYHEEKFIADKILLKCPSKYQEDKIQL